MAIARLGPIVAAVSGSIGSSTFKETKFGSVIAQRGFRPPSLSADQAAVKSAYSKASRFWWRVDDETRRAWNIAAETMSRSNRLGTTRGLSGNQLFIGFYAWNGGSPYSPVFGPPAFSTAPIGAFTADEIGDSVVLNWALAADPGVNVRTKIWGFRPNTYKTFTQARSWTPLFIQTSDYTGSVTVNPAAWPSEATYTGGEFLMFKVQCQAYGMWKSSPAQVNLSYIAP